MINTAEKFFNEPQNLYLRDLLPQKENEYKTNRKEGSSLFMKILKTYGLLLTWPYQLGKWAFTREDYRKGFFQLREELKK